MVNRPTHADIVALRREIAELRGQLAHIKHALGATDIHGAVAEVRRLRAQSEANTADIGTLKEVTPQ